jgi:hypothetical protein
MSLAQIRRSRWWLAPALAAAGLVVLAGCSSTASASGTTGESSSTTGGTVASSDTQMDAFASCLAENGVSLPEPGGPPAAGSADRSAPPEGGAPGAGGTPPAPEGVDADTWAAALQACADVMPTPPPAS